VTRTPIEHVRGVGGTPKWKLAEQYGISESSVKRLIRKASDA
jgi:hypothetical protein